MTNWLPVKKFASLPLWTRSAGSRRPSIRDSAIGPKTSSPPWNGSARQGAIPRRSASTIRVDQGTEFVSRDLDLWAYANGVTLDFSRPGKPTDNAFIEAFNGRFRAECLRS